jgi:hypothetical protein
MNEVVAIVEGQTEQSFVRDHLAAHLGAFGITIWPVLSGKARRHGGVRKWESARGDILRALREGRYVTTMVDFYGMPNDWPDRVEASQLAWDQRGEHVEQGIAKAIAEAVGDSFDSRQLIPYVQMHEFEALLFADVAKMAEELAPLSRLTQATLGERFKTILDQAGPAEAINDRRETCPSRRITGVVPAYDKADSGPRIAGRIGLEVMRSNCPHFGQWLGRLESIGAAAPAS